MMISLNNLPIELSYRILNYLSPFEILMSTRNVSTSLNAIIDTYQPYQVEESSPLNILSLNLILFQNAKALAVPYTKIRHFGIEHFVEALKKNQVTKISIYLRCWNQSNPQSSLVISNSSCKIESSWFGWYAIFCCCFRNESGKKKNST